MTVTRSQCPTCKSKFPARPGKVYCCRSCRAAAGAKRRPSELTLWRRFRNKKVPGDERVFAFWQLRRRRGGQSPALHISPPSLPAEDRPRKVISVPKPTRPKTP